MKYNTALTLVVFLAAGLSLAVPGCPPQINSITPDAGLVGDVVQIMGANFGEAQVDGTITFSGVDAGTADAWSDSEIVIAVPEGAATGDVVVTAGGQPSNGFLFMLLADCATFAGGQFGFELLDVTDTCFDGIISELFEQAIMEVDLGEMGSAELPPTSALPLEFEMGLPGAEILLYGIDHGKSHCWEGAQPEVHDPVSIDLFGLTGGQIDCTIVIGDVLFAMDYLSEDSVVIALTLEVDSMEGEMCPPNNAPDCTITVRLNGVRAEPE
ncbi:IPT/TIG domain-containing protein [Thermodesulfobacteriota bacterium]